MEGIVHVNGISIAYREEGRGPAVVLVHGKNNSKELMAGLLEHLAPRHTAVAYDVRGHGASDKPDAFTLADHAADLVGLCRELHLDHPAVIGFSMGSYIALRAAELYPGTFSKLVLIGTKGAGASSTQKIQEDALARGLSREEAAQEVLAHIFAPTTSPEQVAEFNRLSRGPVRLTKEQKQAINRSIRDVDLLPDISRVTVPVLVLTGDHDGINPPAEGRKVAQALPDGTFKEVPDAGHSAFLENPAAVTADIDAFLGR